MMTQSDITKAFEGRWRIKVDMGQINSNSATMSFDEFYDYIKSICRDFFEAGILIAEGSCQQVSPAAPKNSIELRAESFYQQVHSPEFISKYPKQMLDDFFSYWSEPNRSNTKMLHEMQKTWDLSRRLARWARNDFNKYGTNKPTIEEQRIAKLADIIAG